MNFTHGSLFSGIGGFDLAAEWMGWENKFHCEWNEFGQRVLKYYWPQSESYGDITKTDFTIWRNRIDILTGGFPCQPYSMAGKRLGTEDNRHLWPEMLRAIREIQPRYVVGENVYGLINWNGGLVFDEVQADLENEGYQIQPVILPACSKNAPHKRERIWFVAYSNSSTTRPPGEGTGFIGKGSKNNDEPEKRGEQAKQHIGCGDVLWTDTDTAGRRRDGPRFKTQSGQKEPRPVGVCNSSFNATNTDSNGRGENNERREPRQPNETSAPTNWQNFPTQPPVCLGNDGLPARLDGITVSKWRNQSIKAYGNAIVPQVVFEIFKAIEHTEKEMNLPKAI